MTCKLEDVILSNNSSSPSTLQDVGFIPAANIAMQVHELPEFGFMDTHSSYNVNYDSKRIINTISLLIFPPNLGDRCMKGLHVHLRFVSNGRSDLGRNERLQAKSFSVQKESNVTLTQLGRTGHRAVWIERNLESDDVCLVKFTSNSDNASPPEVSVLLPPQPGLPFKPRDCRAIAFDDAIGRLCLGLYSGELYVLDYA